MPVQTEKAVRGVWIFSGKTHCFKTLTPLPPPPPLPLPVTSLVIVHENGLWLNLALRILETDIKFEVLQSLAILIDFPICFSIEYYLFIFSSTSICFWFHLETGTLAITNKVSWEQTSSSKEQSIRLPMLNNFNNIFVGGLTF